MLTSEFCSLRKTPKFYRDCLQRPPRLFLPIGNRHLQVFQQYDKPEVCRPHNQIQRTSSKKEYALTTGFLHKIPLKASIEVPEFSKPSLTNNLRTSRRCDGYSRKPLPIQPLSNPYDFPIPRCSSYKLLHRKKIPRGHRPVH